METMDTRQWLGRARTIEREINALMRTKAEARQRLLSITQNYASDGSKSTGKDPHKFDRLMELEDRLNAKIDELIDTKQEITDAIQLLADGRQRTVLLDYYVRCMSMEQIAVEINYSYENVKKIRAKAIRAMEQGNPEKFTQKYPSECDRL